jgi:pimeloyl-[acyl-carrier protein] methyl ester esterase
MITQISTRQDLYIGRSGEGPDVVLLHGWGLHAAVWDSVITDFKTDYRLNYVDLPGHGRSGLCVDLGDMDALCLSLHERVPSPAQWVGWSLGGLIAIAYTLRYPESVERLILVASSPRFVTAANWKAAIPSRTLKAFARDLEYDYQTTLNRFLALQVHSSERAQTTLRQLRHILLKYPTHRSALRAGLALLYETDMREQLPKLGCPTRLILGEKDTLVPKECAKQTVKRLNDAKVTIIPGAGHVPFLSHSQEFNTALRQYLHQK